MVLDFMMIKLSIYENIEKQGVYWKRLNMYLELEKIVKEYKTRYGNDFFFEGEGVVV